MPAPKLSKEDWRELQRASEAGVADDQLSQDYQISQLAIRQRRHREKWLTPAKIRAEVAAEAARRSVLARGNTGAMLSEGRGPVDPLNPHKGEHDVTRVTRGAEKSIVEDFLRDGEAAQKHAMKVLLSKLSRAALDPNSVEDISTVQDTVTALKGARLIAGLDKEGQNVVLNLGAFWNDPGAGAVESPVVVEVEEEQAR